MPHPVLDTIDKTPAKRLVVIGMVLVVLALISVAFMTRYTTVKLKRGGFEDPMLFDRWTGRTVAIDRATGKPKPQSFTWEEATTSVPSWETVGGVAFGVIAASALAGVVIMGAKFWGDARKSHERDST